jgi:hypothetical protein
MGWQDHRNRGAGVRPTSDIAQAERSLPVPRESFVGALLAPGEVRIARYDYSGGAEADLPMT